MRSVNLNSKVVERPSIKSCERFIPPRKIRSISSEGSIVFTYVLSPDWREMRGISSKGPIVFTKVCRGPGSGPGKPRPRRGLPRRGGRPAGGGAWKFSRGEGPAGGGAWKILPGRGPAGGGAWKFQAGRGPAGVGVAGAPRPGDYAEIFYKLLENQRISKNNIKLWLQRVQKLDLCSR